MTVSQHDQALPTRARHPDLRPDRSPEAEDDKPYVRKGYRSTGPRTTTFPTDLMNEATSRLQRLALLYAFTFFMAAFFPNFLFAETRAMLVSGPIHWIPGVISIVVALAVAAVLRFGRLPAPAVMAVALVFEVVSSYGIACAEFVHPGVFGVPAAWVGLSWVAVWILIFNIVMPTVPRYAMMAALGSITAVPAMVTLSLAVFPSPIVTTGFEIFFAFVFPYLLVVVMAYVGVRIVYALGAEVKRARDLGSYRLEERLGVGGMGEVWKANHRFLARPAAIKLIRPPVGTQAISDDTRRRFEREAQVIAQLRSPHTVTLFDFGVAEDGAFYYVMELLDGLDAHTLVKRFGPLPAERVMHVLEQMCHSLSEAESCGVVHRDIKPANVFLSRYGEDCDFVKVLDFGIAKVTHQSAAAETALTVANVIQGTPAFMAPEQALGSADLDTRTDIYATGCVAYWLLTGQLVFTADTPMALLLSHAQKEPEPPSTRTELPIPPALDAVVLSCLSKDRERRPPSVRHLLKALKEIAIPNPWTEDRARKWWGTHLPAAATTGGSDGAMSRSSAEQPITRRARSN